MKKYMKLGNHVGDGTDREDMIIVLDTSPSMDFNDYKPSRLSGAIEAVGALVEVKAKQHPIDRVAIVGFNSGAQVIHPLATVRKACESIKATLARVKTSSCTNITAGLRQAFELMKGDSTTLPVVHRGLLGWVQESIFGTPTSKEQPPLIGNQRRILLLSDGKHNTGPKPVPVAGELKRQGVLIDVVGIGGSPTASEFDEPELKRIASTSQNGEPRYCFISDTEELIRQFKTMAQHIKPMEQTR